MPLLIFAPCDMLKARVNSMALMYLSGPVSPLRYKELIVAIDELVNPARKTAFDIQVNSADAVHG